MSDKDEVACESDEGKDHSHYHKDVSDLDTIDVYEICKLYEVDDWSGCLHHAIKKLLVPGVRGGGKSKLKDVSEAFDTLNRYLEINNGKKNG